MLELGSIHAGSHRRTRAVAAIIGAALVGSALIPANTAAGSSASSEPQPAAAPPEVFEGFVDERPLGTTPTRFRLTVPAGSYAITAKLNAPSLNGQTISCQLSAGGNFDRAVSGTAAVGVSTATIQSMTMIVAHHFPSAGDIVLECSRSSGSSVLTFVKIHATRVNSVTHLRFNEPA